VHARRTRAGTRPDLEHGCLASRVPGAPTAGNERCPEHSESGTGGYPCENLDDSGALLHRSWTVEHARGCPLRSGASLLAASSRISSSASRASARASARPPPPRGTADTADHVLEPRPLPPEVLQPLNIRNHVRIGEQPRQLLVAGSISRSRSNMYSGYQGRLLSLTSVA